MACIIRAGLPVTAMEGVIAEKKNGWGMQA